MAVPKRLEVVDRDRTANLCDVNNENSQVILWHVDIDAAEEVAHRYNLHDELVAELEKLHGGGEGMNCTGCSLVAKAKRREG